ncbi:MAG: hypothetical protein BM485_06125 [Desulfobulbaceae bacterium DB1]|nr:MAG: hypothetical protein BM485_06125 [Desulfobulbaceae bacterium DB1]
MRDQYDKKEGYCRMLGHVLPFHYCRTMNEGLPCGKILDCWFARLPIREFVDTHYSDEERERIFQPPKAKMVSLVEIIENARKQAAKGEPEK